MSEIERPVSPEVQRLTRELESCRQEIENLTLERNTLRKQVGHQLPTWQKAIFALIVLYLIVHWIDTLDMAFSWY
jgi:hypothetical protein